jgi:hypothetical protein
MEIGYAESLEYTGTADTVLFHLAPFCDPQFYRVGYSPLSICVVQSDAISRLFL